MKFKIHIAFVLAVIISLTSYSNNGDKNVKTLSGKVIDAVTGEVLSGVKVKLNGSDNYCYSDLNGNYMLSIPVGEKTEILVETIGYKQNVVKAGDLGFNVTIQLNPLQ